MKISFELRPLFLQFLIEIFAVRACMHPEFWLFIGLFPIVFALVFLGGDLCELIISKLEAAPCDDSLNRRMVTLPERLTLFVVIAPLPLMVLLYSLTLLLGSESTHLDGLIQAWGAGVVISYFHMIPLTVWDKPLSIGGWVKRLRSTKLAKCKHKGT